MKISKKTIMSIFFTLSSVTNLCCAQDPSDTNTDHWKEEIKKLFNKRNGEKLPDGYKEKLKNIVLHSANEQDNCNAWQLRSGFPCNDEPSYSQNNSKKSRKNKKKSRKTEKNENDEPPYVKYCTKEVYEKIKNVIEPATNAVSSTPRRSSVNIKNELSNAIGTVYNSLKSTTLGFLWYQDSPEEENEAVSNINSPSSTNQQNDILSLAGSGLSDDQSGETSSKQSRQSQAGSTGLLFPIDNQNKAMNSQEPFDPIEDVDIDNIESNQSISSANNTLISSGAKAPDLNSIDMHGLALDINNNVQEKIEKDLLSDESNLIKKSNQQQKRRASIPTLDHIKQDNHYSASFSSTMASSNRFNASRIDPIDTSIDPSILNDPLQASGDIFRFNQQPISNLPGVPASNKLKDEDKGKSILVTGMLTAGKESGVVIKQEDVLKQYTNSEDSSITTSFSFNNQNLDHFQTIHEEDETKDPDVISTHSPTSDLSSLENEANDEMIAPGNNPPISPKLLNLTQNTVKNNDFATTINSNPNHQNSQKENIQNRIKADTDSTTPTNKIPDLKTNETSDKNISPAIMIVSGLIVVAVVAMPFRKLAESGVKTKKSSNKG